jgi:hypothetical protein
MNHIRREHHPQHRDDGHYQRQRPEELVGKIPNFVAILFSHVPGENRDKRRGHRPFGHQTPEKIGDTERQLIGHRYFRSPQQHCDALIADIPKNAADNGNKGDDRGRFEDLLLFSQRAPPPA